MTVSTNGFIAFGVLFEEEYEFPWGEDNEDEDQWNKNWPIKTCIINYCSNSFPMIALVLKETVITCLRGDPTEFDPADLVVKPKQLKLFKQMLKKHKLKPVNEPSWLLMSFWSA